MLRLIGIVVSIGLADSLNPTTIAPALYMAEGKRAVRRVIGFTVGVFVVYLLGGLLIVLGPGELIVDLVARPGHTARHVIEIIAGAGMIIASGVLWHKRHELARAEPRRPRNRERSSAILGATITAVELPTAFPYFAAIAAVVGSGISIPRQVFLLVLFNVCFVLPLIAIAIIIAVAGDRAVALLARVRRAFRTHWPKILAGVALVAGVLVILLGISGLLSNKPFGRFVRGRLFQPLGLPPAPKK
ncbi:MAG TPA: GAP family protein [Solirubrobacteraceae bacterium]|jgi:cytochrome c biogenesis protein CcdA|nr:GAP family protein [Solirubrobacteraceae bacterium]